MSEQLHKQERFYSFGFKPSEATTNAHSFRSAEGTCQYMLPTLVQKYEATSNLKLLDIGCGPGSITVSLARYIPNAQVVGVDLSETVLEKATKHAHDEGVGNVSFQVADAYALPFEDGTFDVVHTHQTVVHFTDQVNAIKEFIRVTKKGGVICMREVDLYTAAFYPRDAVLEDGWRRFIGVHERQGVQVDGGRKLKDWTVRAGIPAIHIEFSPGFWCFHTLQQRREFNGSRFWQGSLSDKAVEHGIATREQIEEFQQAWVRWTAAEDGLLMMTHGQVVAHV